MSRYGGGGAGAGGGGGYGQPQQRSSVVFVGNLPFNLTEEQLVETFSSVGQVVSFRLVFDHATGKPKGFGFCEYKDPETAASALRNLQGVEVGGRGLRLDFADTEDAPPSKRGTRGGPPPSYGGGNTANSIGSGAPSAPGGAGWATQPSGGRVGTSGNDEPRPLPAGVPVPAGASAVDSITHTLGTMPPGQLLDIMSQMKALVTASPYDARTLLTNNPQLSYALFQAMLLMEIVDPAVLTKMLPQPAAPVPIQPSPYGSAPPAAYSNAPSGYGAPPPNHNGYGARAPLPPQTGPPVGYPTNYNGAPPSAAAATPPPGVAPEQAELIQRVLSMTQEQIDALPPDSRNTIMQIRAQAAASMGGRR